MLPISLIPKSKLLCLDDLDEFPAATVIVADAYVEQAERWTAQPWGWRTEREGRVILNIDHHAPVERMQRVVSSGNLAMEFVQRHGVPDDATVVVNHCDCDSIVASAILAGHVTPSDDLAEAVIAADHTGEANRIADALQPLEALRDLELSLETLTRLVTGKPLDSRVSDLLEKRQAEREYWRSAVSEPGVVQWAGSVALIESDQRIPAEMLTGMLPEATIIVTACPQTPSGWVMKVRLGQQGLGDLSLNHLGIEKFDPQYGGRWNAGSNSRGDGTAVDPFTYATKLAELVPTDS